MEPEIIIYVLCNNTDKLNSDKYNKYKWAKPILLKYQDYTFENAFWRQLDEIQYEWENCDMVGTVAFSSFKKINLEDVDTIINNKFYLPNKYYHFMDSNVPIPNFNTNKHKHFLTIWNDILGKLSLKNTTENCCNYWMCSPELMKRFISWYSTICYPELVRHPLIFCDAGYSGEDWNNSLTKAELIKLWGKSYYPHFPFIVERLNKCFFETYYPEHIEKPNNFSFEFYTSTYSDLKNLNEVSAKRHYYLYGQFQKRVCDKYTNSMGDELIRYNNLMPKMVFLISHNKGIGGAQNLLLSIKDMYARNGIKTHLLYLEDISNVVGCILNLAHKNNCCPVVFCSTLCCHNLVYKLSKTRILTYWCIHEWYDSFTKQFFEKFISDHSIFNSPIEVIFSCNASLNNYHNIIPIIKNKHIIYNICNPEKLKCQVNEKQNKIIKQNGIVYIAIIGTIEKRKNQQSFIDNVFYRLKDEYTNIRLLIIGRKAEKLIIKPAYIKDIIVTGVVNNALPFIDFSDIIVSYSINEVLPMNIIESFYCSKPVVATDVGGTSEIITDTYDGYLLQTNDHNKCLNILYELVKNKNLRDTIGKKARETFYSRFDEKNAINKFLSLLIYR